MHAALNSQLLEAARTLRSAWRLCNASRPHKHYVGGPCLLVLWSRRHPGTALDLWSQGFVCAQAGTAGSLAVQGD